VSTCTATPRLADLSSLSYVGAIGALASLSLMGVVFYELVTVGGFPQHLPPG
jgi:vesicular inhibitory amino acid transporter